MAPFGPRKVHVQCECALFIFASIIVGAYNAMALLAFAVWGQRGGYMMQMGEALALYIYYHCSLIHCASYCTTDVNYDMIMLRWL